VTVSNVNYEREPGETEA